MARINIEPRWFSDPRRAALTKRLGSKRLADGLLVEVADLLIDYKGQGIPFAKFKFIENFQDWLDCGLGTVTEGLVQVAGSDQYRKFFEKQKSNGLLGKIHGIKGGRPNNPQITPKNPQKRPSSSSSSSSSKEEEIYKAFPLVAKDRLEAKHGSGSVRDALHEVVTYWSCSAASETWSTMIWAQKTAAWITEKSRRDKANVKKVPELSTGGYDDGF